MTPFKLSLLWWIGFWGCSAAAPEGEPLVQVAAPTPAPVIPAVTEELMHADMVAMRIIQLGGTPVTKPEEWYKFTNCGYDAPDDPFVKTLLEQNIRGEQCAIGVYKRLMDITREKDPVTYNMVLTILQQEVEHEEDLQSLLEDYELMMRAFKE